MKKIAAIILAAGQGSRMQSKKVNKVVYPLGKKQMILYTVERLADLSSTFLKPRRKKVLDLFISPIIVIVGFAKESVIKILEGKVIFAYQNQRLGTAHALMCGLKKLPGDIGAVLVLNGDDSAFYTESIIKKLIKTHWAKNAALSFLTITVENPMGLGRVIRDGNGKAVGIVEEKDATLVQRKINEINPACYIFEVDFLKKYLKQVKKSEVTGEYYLTSLIDIAIKNNEQIETMRGGKIAWRGINTPKELLEAERLFSVIKK